MFSYGQPYTIGVAVALQQARYLIFYMHVCSALSMRLTFTKRLH